MSKLNSFTFITLNGFYKGPGGDTSWHSHGGEAAKFANTSSGGGGILLFGRKTYEMMAAFWPTPMAAESFPVVAANMNKAEKIVLSDTLKEASWQNTRIMSGDVIEQLRQLKQTGKKDITILGSGSLLVQLSDASLIDTYTIMLDPVALGKGSPVFEGIKNKLELKLVSGRIFEKDGIVLLNYEKAGR